MDIIFVIVVIVIAAVAWIMINNYRTLKKERNKMFDKLSAQALAMNARKILAEEAYNNYKQYLNIMGLPTTTLDMATFATEFWNLLQNLGRHFNVESNEVFNDENILILSLRFVAIKEFRKSKASTLIDEELIEVQKNGFTYVNNKSFPQ